MAIEKVRGCGYRKVGGLYLMGTGIAVPCDMLPLALHPCEYCGFQIPFSRGFMWISPMYLNVDAEKHHKETECKCIEIVKDKCPVCFPKVGQGKYGFMWVGARHYTPESFVKESKEVGVCKKIAKIPKDLEFGKTWILLAHRKVPFSPELNPNGLRAKEPEYKPAIFYAFRVTRIEKLIWKSKATKRRLNKLKEQGDNSRHCARRRP